MLSTFLLKYINILIHSLLKAGQGIMTDTHKIENLNLVIFRVSDLMRSKLHCKDISTFRSVLNTLYELDNSPYMSGKFKLMRIKSKLDEPASNVMINYLFMGKIQCELQLSIQEVKGKEKNNYTFSHFIY